MDSASEPVRARLETVVADRTGERDAWTVEVDGSDRVTIRLPDRTLVVRRRDGPDGATHWTLELAAEGATVSKFGPLASVAELSERVRTLLEADVRYTVCCDG